jgi:hypothetical protein
LLPLFGQMSKRLLNHLCSFGSKQRFIDFRTIAISSVEFRVLVDEDDSFPRRQVPEAFVPCRSRKPRTDTVGLLDPVDVLDESHPGCLNHIRGVAFTQLEPRGDGPDQLAVLIDDLIPSLDISVCDATQEETGVRGLGIQEINLSVR